MYFVYLFTMYYVLCIVKECGLYICCISVRICALSSVNVCFVNTDILNIYDGPAPLIFPESKVTSGANTMAEISAMNPKDKRYPMH